MPKEPAQKGLRRRLATEANARRSLIGSQSCLRCFGPSSPRHPRALGRAVEAICSVAELAAVERINTSYLCRVLRLILLAPDLVEAVLDGRAERHYAPGAHEAVSGGMGGAEALILLK